ncbi:putative receptor-like protein kinase [Iris pallida]|uniref:Receptor-like protein kinase n=1 Tax=Iris pallida TaxID=29817 RepID=A0AAX6GMK6_IRIPA|nr:putative receptor-like protein kinase [Iris pallida]
MALSSDRNSLSPCSSPSIRFTATGRPSMNPLKTEPEPPLPIRSRKSLVASFSSSYRNLLGTPPTRPR